MPTAFLPRRAPISNRPHERSGADRTQPRRPVPPNAQRPPDALGTDGIQRPKPKPCRSSPPLGNSVSSLPRGRTRPGRASGPGHRCPVPPNAQSPPRGRPCPGHPEPKNRTNSRPVCHPNNVASVPGGGPASGCWQRELTSRPAEHPAVRTIHPGLWAACVSRCPTATVTGGGPALAAGRGNREAGLWVRPPLNQFHSNPAPPPSTGRRSANQLMGV